MRLFGLIGYPLAHSQSPEYFQRLWEKENITDCRYALFPLENLQQLHKLLKENQELQGLNVTSPFKESVLAYADAVSEEVKHLHCANVLHLCQGKITAYNTDHLGFDHLLAQCTQVPKNALICGSGGAARAVQYSLQRHSIKSTLLSRTRSKGNLSYDDLDASQMENFSLIINATPLGMGNLRTAYPPLPYQNLNPKQTLIDLIYNPSETFFLKKGRAMGCQCLNGLAMLHAQADETWKIWKRC